MDFLKGHRLILGSTSPRRKELLERMDMPFIVRTFEVDESYPDHLIADQIAEFLAQKKAEAHVPQLLDNEILITCDTIVNRNGKVLSKPENEIHARLILEKLSGSQHLVHTGVCLTSLQKKVVFTDTTQVWFKALSRLEIDYYLNTYKPYDKAGAYGIQEWIGLIGIEKIEGSYFNVMGLPTAKLFETLANFIV